MRLDAKAVAIRAVTSLPLYRVVPNGALRTYAALRYHSANSSREVISAYVRQMRRPPTSRFSTAVIAARAAFRTADDELVDDLLRRIEHSFPAEAQLFELRADLRGFQGKHARALADAEQARFLEPARVTAMARVVRFHYLSGHPDADRVAVEAVRRFPGSEPVLWAVAKACSTDEQYERILTAWHESRKVPEDLVWAARPLATAAARGGPADEAVRLYREAITLMANGHDRIAPMKATRLQGRGAWSAIEDLRDALDGASVPFFFAAGTALGLVREGGPLSHDGDIDVGILERDWDRDALVELFRTDRRFELDPHPRSKKVALKHRGGSPIDVFPYYEEAGRLWHDGVFVRWSNSPFSVERREIMGVKLPVPAEADRYLTENYGDWRTPDPDFDAFTTDAPNVEVRWPEYYNLHLLRRAYRKLSEHDRPGAVLELEAAGEDDLAARIGANRG